MNKYYKLINDVTKQCLVADISRDEDIKILQESGYILGDVTFGHDGSWYLTGYEPPVPTIKENMWRIDELKNLLASTDYQAIKYAEGQITEEEYAEIKAQRQAWRDEINELEKIIK